MYGLTLFWKILTTCFAIFFVRILLQIYHLLISHIFLSISIIYSWCFMVSGETLDKELGHGRRNAYYSVLFYASWCPFSQTTRQLFDALNVLFPGIQHFAVEESSALPSVFSRYGVHSFPSILIMNGTTRVRYRGSKDLISLLLFYMKTTGLEPVTYFPGDHPFDIRAQKRTAREMLRREPYLALSLLFLFFKAFVYVSPQIWSQVKALWLSYGWSHLLKRALHAVDVKRLWSKLTISKKRNFQKGASNARAWASSLTSVSLGESASSRPISSSS
ncbi:unnamed protein product [Spirodela intermedia]|uniref:Uncharacterized protein n=1 Tax=Spirodela intermedia TaxID=51605 RepID=A0A7I8I7Q8_SPIIN|nr:unnamed protein product [Spirodela intermedia]CAA6653657.1 unnamed protein product [Spirodela intermedia]